ncbi:MAG: formate dehydrogenase accessory sulfurtransferase FdhD [Chloroflexota bacterium]
MVDSTASVPIRRVTEAGQSPVEDTVATEAPLTIILNNQELVTLLCSPANLAELAVGFLSSEGLLKGRDDIARVLTDPARGVVRVTTREDREIDADLLSKRFITSGCGRGASFYQMSDVQDREKVASSLMVTPGQIADLVKEFQHRSLVYRNTGGVHSAALCDSDNILVFTEDIGRHNAVDKIFGHCLLQGLPTEDRLIISSGRISSEIVLKVSRRGIPILVSKSAPTSLGVKLAADLGITLVGFARGRRMNIYSGEQRVAADSLAAGAL